MSTQQAEAREFNSTEQQTVFDKLFQPIKEFIEEQNNVILQHHNQTYFYPEFVRTLVFFFTHEYNSLKLFINTILNGGLLPNNLHLRAVPYSTFSDAFERFSPDLFRALFVFLLSSLQLKKIPELASLGTLYCIDGSLFPVISSMLWAEYTSKKQALRLHLCFELNRMIAVDFIIGSGKSSERSALRKMLAKGITYIADRGYMSFDIFKDIIDMSSYFVFRVKSNMVYSTIECMIVELPVAVQSLFDNVTDSRIQYVNDPHKLTYRLVRFRIGKEIFYLLTNRFDISVFQIIMLYAYRWQIELFFRFLKRTIHGIHLIKNTQDGVTIQFYVLLITALLELNLKQESMQKSEANKGLNAIIDSCCEVEIEPGNPTNIVTVGETNNKHVKSEVPISDIDQFREMIGGNLKKYWKISIHWLSALRSIISNAFDGRAIEILSTL